MMAEELIEKIDEIEHCGQEKELIQTNQMSNDTEQLFNDNIKLATRFCKERFRLGYCINLSWEDAIQACRTGLWKACLIFDPGKGKLSPLAYLFMRGELNRAARDAAPAGPTADVTGTIQDRLPPELTDADALADLLARLPPRCHPRTREVLALLAVGHTQREVGLLLSPPMSSAMVSVIVLRAARLLGISRTGKRRRARRPGRASRQRSKCG
jgi:hypothetical protein